MKMIIINLVDIPENISDEEKYSMGTLFQITKLSTGTGVN